MKIYWFTNNWDFVKAVKAKSEEKARAILGEKVKYELFATTDLNGEEEGEIADFYFRVREFQGSFYARPLTHK